MNKQEFKRVENILNNYNTIKAIIKNQLLEIDIISKTYEGISSISYEEKTGPTYKITSSVESEMLKKEKKIKELEIEIAANQKIITMVDNALDLLGSSERKLIELKYFNCNQLSWEQIGYTLGFSGDYCRTKLRNKVIEHMHYMLFINPYKQFKFENF